MLLLKDVKDLPLQLYLCCLYSAADFNWADAALQRYGVMNITCRMFVTNFANVPHHQLVDSDLKDNSRSTL